MSLKADRPSDSFTGYAVAQLRRAFSQKPLTPCLPLFQSQIYPQALAGKLVLVGEDQGDFFASPKISIEDAAKRFRCVRPVLDPAFATVNEDRADVFVIGTMLNGFETRLESAVPTVVEGDAG